MKVLENLDALTAPPEAAVLTLGNFDGVHRGHAKLFSLVVEEARRIRGTAVMMTFDPHPSKLLRPEMAPPLLTTREQKLGMVEKAGMDLVMVLPFTPDLCRTTATDFVESILVARFQPRTIFIGTPFRFGHNREGDVPLLQALGQRLGFRAEGVGVVDEAGETISATRIRRALLDGRAGEASRMLGRPYEITGKVIEGAHRGRELAFPTANLAVDHELVPGSGVYATRLRLEDKLLDSVTNIGTRPTFGEIESVVETHVLDFQGNLYGQQIGLQFLERLREEVKFDSREELVAQIQADIAQARRVLSS